MMRKYITERCPHCETEVSLFWNTEQQGFVIYCPNCGKPILLCDECKHTDGETHDCDWSSETGRCHRSKPMSPAVLTPADPTAIRNIAYQRYQMWWCVNHGVTVADILAKYSEYWGEVEADSEDTGFDTFLAQTGFNGELWACQNEFLDSEYKDPTIMWQILDPVQYSDYVRDRIAELTQNKEEEAKNE